MEYCIIHSKFSSPSRYMVGLPIVQKRAIFLFLIKFANSFGKQLEISRTSRYMIPIVAESNLNFLSNLCSFPARLRKEFANFIKKKKTTSFKLFKKRLETLTHVKFLSIFAFRPEQNCVHLQQFVLDHLSAE